MRKILFIILTSLFLASVSLFTQDISMNLKQFNYIDDVVLQGLSPNFTFYVPVGNFENIYGSSLKIRYKYSEISGNNTIMSVYVNDIPVSTTKLPEKTGLISIPIPSSLIRINSFVKIEIMVKMDYSKCDMVNVGVENLWFMIDNDSEITFNYENKIENTSISSFFSEINGFDSYNFIYENKNISDIKTISAVSEYIGSVSKGYKREITVSSTINSDDNYGNIDILDENILKISEDGKTVSAGGEIAISAFSTEFLGILDSYSSNLISEEDEKREMIKLIDIGLPDDYLEIVYGLKSILDIPLELFGSTPETAMLNLHLSSFDQLEGEKIFMNVFFNGYLIGKTILDNESIDEIFYYNIPSAYFLPFNRLEFFFKQYNAECKSSYVKIYKDSFISFSGTSSLKNDTVSQFPNSVFGKTLYIVSDISMETASMLAKLSYMKGTGSAIDEFGNVITIDNFLNKESEIKDYDSIIGILSPSDIEKIDKSLSLSDGIKIINSETGKVIFESQLENDMLLVRTLDYKDKPVFLLSYYGDTSVLSKTTIDDLNEFKRIPGNLGILKNGKAISFSIGEELIPVLPEKTDQEDNFWYRYRFIIVLCLVVIAVVLLILSYRKTSSGR